MSRVRSKGAARPGCRRRSGRRESIGERIGKSVPIPPDATGKLLQVDPAFDAHFEFETAPTDALNL